MNVTKMIWLWAALFVGVNPGLRAQSPVPDSHQAAAIELLLVTNSKAMFEQTKAMFEQTMEATQEGYRNQFPGLEIGRASCRERV